MVIKLEACYSHKIVSTGFLTRQITTNGVILGWIGYQAGSVNIHLERTAHHTAYFCCLATEQSISLVKNGRL